MGRMRRILRAGGPAAGVLLVAPGAVWARMGATARGEVRDTIVQEQITGSPGMSPATFGESDIVGALPACDVAERPIDADERARCLAEWMRVHALHSTEGRTHSEMEHFLDDQGREVFTEEEAATNAETGRPVENPARQVRVSQRAPRGSSWPTPASRCRCCRSRPARSSSSSAPASW